MNSKKLSYGLNVSKKPSNNNNNNTRTGKDAPSRTGVWSGFGGGDDDDDDDDDDVDKVQPPKPQQQMSLNLLKKKSALELPQEVVDESVYDYDAAWDNMKALEKRKDEKDDKRPRYMSNLLAAAEVRKRDQLRAKERLLQRDREAEGEEFNDKEKFVTGAYKKQQEEMKAAEEEEKSREDSMAGKSQGMTSFYRNMLDKTEEQHSDKVAVADQNPKNGNTDSDLDEEKEISNKDIARKVNEKYSGAIQVNDEGEVVDKRELLSAGLNIKPKNPASKNSSSSNTSSIRDSGYNKQSRHDRDSQHARRERQNVMLQEQKGIYAETFCRSCRGFSQKS